MYNGLKISIKAGKALVRALGNPKIPNNIVNYEYFILCTGLN